VPPIFNQPRLELCVPTIKNSPFHYTLSMQHLIDKSALSYSL
jgi:hypothetical protein